MWVLWRGIKERMVDVRGIGWDEVWCMDDCFTIKLQINSLMI